MTELANDSSSYHISPERFGRRLGYELTHTVEDPVSDITEIFARRRIPGSITDLRYSGITIMLVAWF